MTKMVMKKMNLNFWGRDEHRSVTLAEQADEEMEDEEEDESDLDSTMDDCDDEDGDEEDEFELLGHR